MFAYRVKLNSRTKNSDYAMLGAGILAVLLIGSGFILAASSFSSLDEMRNVKGSSAQSIENKNAGDVRG